ncbi:MAG: diaminopimelate epimerase [Dehalococcoidia bacterium]|nr:diaminopimelate epimerase [Dehalococcoidia bacterium]
MRFAKMHGIGNDFALVDARAVAADWPSLAQRMCDRHYGVGADGLILLQESDHADATMRMFNPDGSEAEMCGNGIRCLARFAIEIGAVPADRDTLSVQTGAGTLAVTLHREAGRVRSVTVDMGAPRLHPADIPVDTALASGDRVMDYPLRVGDHTIRVTAVSMGNPHAVAFVDSVADYPLAAIGPQVERHPFFPRRVNFEIAHVRDRRHVDARVWERGAGLTLACGTGACATMVAAFLHGLVDDEVEVQLPGGPLTIRWPGNGAVLMRGGADLVFWGDWPTGD